MVKLTAIRRIRLPPALRPDRQTTPGYTPSAPGWFTPDRYGGSGPGPGLAAVLGGVEVGEDVGVDGGSVVPVSGGADVVVSGGSVVVVEPVVVDVSVVSVVVVVAISAFSTVPADGYGCG